MKQETAWPKPCRSCKKQDDILTPPGLWPEGFFLFVAALAVARSVVAPGLVPAVLGPLALAVTAVLSAACPGGGLFLPLQLVQNGLQLPHAQFLGLFQC